MKLHTSLSLSTALLLCGCATLPSSGPTGNEVSKGVARDTQLGLSLVEVDSMAAIPSPPAAAVSRLSDRPSPPTDMVGPGDVLSVAIYEAGVTLFSGTPAVGGAGAAMDAGARATLPELRVDDYGDITIPMLGSCGCWARPRQKSRPDPPGAAGLLAESASLGDAAGSDHQLGDRRR
jgi:polysaccharide export outer membrane protein